MIKQRRFLDDSLKLGFCSRVSILALICPVPLFCFAREGIRPQVKRPRRIFDSCMMIAGTCWDGNTSERGSILQVITLTDREVLLDPFQHYVL